MIEPHQEKVLVTHSFSDVYNWLKVHGEISLSTASGSSFTVLSTTSKHGNRKGNAVIRFFVNGIEYGRAYKCCWGAYYNCNRTRIGMYCKALDLMIQA